MSGAGHIKTEDRPPANPPEPVFSYARMAAYRSTTFSSPSSSRSSRRKEG